MTLLENIENAIEKTGIGDIILLGQLGLGIGDENVEFLSPIDRAAFQSLVDDGILYQPDKNKKPNLFRVA